MNTIYNTTMPLSRRARRIMKKYSTQRNHQAYSDRVPVVLFNVVHGSGLEQPGPDEGRAISEILEAVLESNHHTKSPDHVMQCQENDSSVRAGFSSVLEGEPHTAYSLDVSTVQSEQACENMQSRSLSLSANLSAHPNPSFQDLQIKSEHSSVTEENPTETIELESTDKEGGMPRNWNPFPDELLKSNNSTFRRRSLKATPGKVIGIEFLSLQEQALPSSSTENNMDMEMIDSTLKSELEPDWNYLPTYVNEVLDTGSEVQFNTDPHAQQEKDTMFSGEHSSVIGSISEPTQSDLPHGSHIKHSHEEFTSANLSTRNISTYTDWPEETFRQELEEEYFGGDATNSSVCQEEDPEYVLISSTTTARLSDTEGDMNNANEGFGPSTRPSPAFHHDNFRGGSDKQYGTGISHNPSPTFRYDKFCVGGNDPDDTSNDTTANHELSGSISCLSLNEDSAVVAIDQSAYDSMTTQMEDLVAQNLELNRQHFQELDKCVAESLLHKQSEASGRLVQGLRSLLANMTVKEETAVKLSNRGPMGWNFRPVPRTELETVVPLHQSSE